MKTQHLGQHAETIAANYLQQEGYVILERNLHVHRYEIDIIAEIDQCIVVVEVKALSLIHI